MKQKLLALAAWTAAGLILLAAILNFSLVAARQGEGGAFQLINQFTWMAVSGVSAVTAALIISRQPRNVIGWLLMVPALPMVIPNPGSEIFPVNAPPLSPSIGFYAALWFDNCSWVLLIFPVLLILLLFPNGKPPSPRWNWAVVYTLLMASIILFLITFSKELAPMDMVVSWSARNPIGFISSDFFESDAFTIPWLASLTLLTMACVSAVVVRFRRAGSIERAQIKWFLYACAVFGVVYFITIILGFSSRYEGSQPLPDLMLALSMMALPLAIATAILRHRLFDIDVIIRKTLVYGALTGMLGLAFFGSVLVLQSLFTLVLGEQSQIAIVISTLAIAALFSPLRIRVQTFIDRRFFRQKYDAEQLMENFARRTRDETDLDALTSYMMLVVTETMQPEQMSLWMKNRK